VIVAIHPGVHPEWCGEQVGAEVVRDVSRVVNGVEAEGAKSAEGATPRRRFADADDLGRASLAPEENAFTHVAAAFGQDGGDDNLALVVEPADLEVKGKYAPFRPRSGVADDGHWRDAEAIAQQRAELQSFHPEAGPPGALRTPAIPQDYSHY
jgi:hypothetical protein